MNLANRWFDRGVMLVIGVIGMLFLIVLPSARVLAGPAEVVLPMSQPDLWKQQGQLVTVRISPGSPIRIYIAGREEAKIDPGSKSLVIRRLKPYPGKVLKINRENDYYVVAEPEEFRKSTEIEVVTKAKSGDETFRFELKPELP